MNHRIGIIYSPGFGAGWSTWGNPESALDQELANAIENKESFEIIKSIAAKNWPGQYTGGLEDCVVEWVDKGTQFIIDEYDGNESVHFNFDNYWMVAK